MLNDIRHSEWMIRAMTKDDEEFQQVLERDKEFNKKFQKFMNGLTSAFFYSFQLTAIFQSFWIIEIEFIPNIFQSTKTNDPLIFLGDFLCTSSLVLLYFTTLRSFYQAARINTAKIQNQSQTVELETIRIDDDDLNESNCSEEFGNSYKRCQLCSVEKDQGTHHCRVCQVCVEGMDHHCYFLGNCVGARNYSYFFSYFFLVMVLSLISLVCLAPEIIKLSQLEFSQLKVNVWRLMFVYISGIFVVLLSMYIIQSQFFDLYYSLRLLSQPMEVLKLT